MIIEIDESFSKLAQAGEHRIDSLQRELSSLDGAGIARELRHVYGFLEAVEFISPPPKCRSVLIFKEGIGLLVGSDTPIQLTFGYVGQGPSEFSKLLEEYDFLLTETSNITAPMRLYLDGSTVDGQSKDGSILWIDGSITENP